MPEAELRSCPADSGAERRPAAERNELPPVNIHRNYIILYIIHYTIIHCILYIIHYIHLGFVYRIAQVLTQGFVHRIALVRVVKTRELK